MRHRPLSLSFMAIVFFVIALGFYLQPNFLYDVPLWQPQLIIRYLTYLNIISMLLCLLITYFSLLGHKWLLFLVPIGVCCLGWNNYIVGLVAIDYGLIITSIGTLLVTGVSAICLFSTPRSLWRHQNLRWWLTPRRFAIQVPLKLQHHETLISAHSYNISSTGAFVTSDQYTSLQQGKSVQLTFQLPSGFHVNTEADIVRINHGQQQSPVGLGLKFRNLNLYQKFRIRFDLWQSSLRT